ncbi:hypothetical protein HW561_11295 [Rhodobacteraceae bacterium B1Z28]|uniref:Uncharacterized protein n=1 Tax=Ruegeria haliotis TaxID=2747601 RepID=A0ABX2PRL9_9RHOB|nr:hypothetical protein [Ruegeria haliotis]NVO56375.1 hypothetical protein [Ruegeria haliotis]
MENIKKKTLKQQFKILSPKLNNSAGHTTLTEWSGRNLRHNIYTTVENQPTKKNSELTPLSTKLVVATPTGKRNS